MGFPKAQWLTSSSLPAFRGAGHVTPQIFMLSFFENLRSITTFLIFPTWGDLLATLAFARPPPVAS
jgi:hypothetical protein